MKKTVSVIIPAYNVGNYIQECLKSLMMQSYKDIEILVVNDGSTDKTAVLVDAIRLKDDRIKLINQENMGTWSARMRGVQEAESEYICFVDADDTVSKEYISDLVVECNNCDLVTSGVIREEKNKTFTKRIDAIPEGEYDLKRDFDYIAKNLIFFEETNQDGILPYVVSKLFRKNIVNKIIDLDIPRINIGEDRLFSCLYVLNCSRIKIIYLTNYKYRYSSVSAMHRKQNHYMQDLDGFYNVLREQFIIHECSALALNRLEKFVSSRVLHITQHLGFNQENRTVRFYLPYDNLKEKNGIVIYGAGEVGNNYYRELKQYIDEDKILWIDKDGATLSLENPKIHLLSDIDNFSYDIILIAVKNVQVASDIKRELMDYGIDEGKITWKPPIELQNI